LVVRKKKKVMRRKVSTSIVSRSVELPTPPSLPFKVHVHALPVCRGNSHGLWCSSFGREILCRAAKFGKQKLAICTHHAR